MTGLRELLEQPSSPEGARTTLAAEYGIPVDQIRMEPHGNSTNLTWKDQVSGIEGNMSFESSRPFRIGLGYRQRAPTGDTLIACLGEPDRYGVFFRGPGPGGNNLLIVDLYFLRYGMLAGTILDRRGKEIPKVNGSIVLDSYLLVPAGSRDETLHGLSGEMPSFRQQFKPWPGRWEDLIVDVDPYVR